MAATVEETTMEQCGRCSREFDTLAEVFSHECLTTSGRFRSVDNGFGGTTTVKVEQAPAKPKPIVAEAPEVDYDEALIRTKAWIRVQFADRKFEVADVTPKLQWLAEQFARRYSSDRIFQFMEDMHANVVKWNSLTPGQAKGVLNCIRTDALRETSELVRRVEPAPQSEAEVATPAPKNEWAQSGIDLRTLPESAHGILRVAVPDHTTGDLVFLAIAQKRRNGDIVVCQEVGGNDDLYLGRQQTKAGKTYIGKRQAELRVVLGDPQAAIATYGLHFTRCGMCGTQLTDADSIADGIGPKCKAKAGW